MLSKLGMYTLQWNMWRFRDPQGNLWSYDAGVYLIWICHINWSHATSSNGRHCKGTHNKASWSHIWQLSSWFARVRLGLRSTFLDAFDIEEGWGEYHTFAIGRFCWLICCRKNAWIKDQWLVFSPSGWCFSRGFGILARAQQKLIGFDRSSASFALQFFSSNGGDLRIQCGYPAVDEFLVFDCIDSCLHKASPTYLSYIDMTIQFKHFPNGGLYDLRWTYPTPKPHTRLDHQHLLQQQGDLLARVDFQCFRCLGQDSLWIHYWSRQDRTLGFCQPQNAGFVEEVELSKAAWK